MAQVCEPDNDVTIITSSRFSFISISRSHVRASKVRLTKRRGLQLEKRHLPSPRALATLLLNLPRPFQLQIGSYFCMFPSVYLLQLHGRTKYNSRYERITWKKRCVDRLYFNGHRSRQNSSPTWWLSSSICLMWLFYQVNLLEFELWWIPRQNNNKNPCSFHYLIFT